MERFFFFFFFFFFFYDHTHMNMIYCCMYINYSLACCLFLSAKFNDPKAFAELKQLLEAIERHLGISPKELIHAEFMVFTKISFGLFVEPKGVLTQLSRLQISIETGQ